MEEAAKILARGSEILSSCGYRINSFTRDPRILQWEEVNFETVNPALLQHFSIPANFSKTLKESCSKTDSYRKQIENLENISGELRMDINHKSIGSAQAKSRAVQLEKQCAALAESMQTCAAPSEKLFEIDNAIRQGLTLENLLPLARGFAGKKLNQFDQGLQVYGLAAEDPARKGSVLDDYFTRTTQLQDILMSLELAEISGIALEVINHNVGIVLDSIGLVKEFLADAKEGLHDKLGIVKSIVNDTESFKTAEIAALFKKLEMNAVSLKNCIIDFQFKSHLLKELQMVDIILNDIHAFQKALRKQFLPDFKSRSNEPGASINPDIIISEKADAFFSGFSGLMRTVKMLISSITGRQVISDHELQGILAEVLRTCPSFYGKDKKAITRMEQFIEGFISGYDRPFPHEQLQAIIKTTIATYAERIEKFFNSYKMDKKSLTENEDNQAKTKSIPSSFGKLIMRIETRTEKLINS